MDEPTSALDPISTSKIEELVLRLKKGYTVIMITYNMQRQPVAGDLRKIRSATQMCSGMERVGDHATKLAEQVIAMQ